MNKTNQIIIWALVVACGSSALFLAFGIWYYLHDNTTTSQFSHTRFANDEVSVLNLPEISTPVLVQHVAYQYTIQLRMPEDLLQHWSAAQGIELIEIRGEQGHERKRIQKGGVVPHQIQNGLFGGGRLGPWNVMVDFDRDDSTCVIRMVRT